MNALERTSRLKLLYRQALKHSSSWMVSRWHWFDETRQIRARFEANSDVEDPAVINKLLADGEAELRKNAHPDLYTSPFNPGSSLYGRNPPPPLNNIEMDFGREKGTF
jgi:hypothetical protein